MNYNRRDCGRGNGWPPYRSAVMPEEKPYSLLLRSGHDICPASGMMSIRSGGDARKFDLMLTAAIWSVSDMFVSDIAFIEGRPHNSNGTGTVAQGE